MTNGELRRALRRLQPDLKAIRERAGLTLAEVAREAGVRHQTSPWEWEAGRCLPSGETGELYLALMLRLSREHPAGVRAEAAL